MVRTMLYAHLMLTDDLNLVSKLDNSIISHNTNVVLLKPFFVAAISLKVRFSLGEEQVMLVNNECGSWYNRVGNFLYQFRQRH